ncbi:MAG: hypothetical protein V1914_00710 [archaeon]
MIVINSGPGWFYGLDTIFELVCGLITLLISMLSYRVYRFAKQKRYYYLFASFLLISFAFALRAVGVFLMHLGFYDRIISPFGMFDFIFLGQMTLMLFAFTILLLVSMGVKSRRVIAFVMALMALFILFSYQYFLKFHVVMFVLMFFLAANFYLNYRKQRNLNSALVFSGFYMLMLAQPFFLFSARLSQNYYIAGQTFQVIGFLALFLMLIRVIRSK